MLRNEPKQFSMYSILYNRIPENHILKTINKAVNFNFINGLLENSYCKYYGRPAKEPEMMAKLLIIQYLYNLSDEQVIEETAVNLAYMYFIGINPDDELPDPSLLSKFRRQRLGETTLDEIIKEMVRQCVDQGIIKGQSISIDATHTHANTIKKVPERIMKHLAKKILAKIEKENGIIPETINSDIPDYKLIEDHNKAKAVMKNYLVQLIKETRENIDIKNKTGIQDAIEKTERILNSPKFIEQKGIRSLVDEDARIGRKSKAESFYGYKTEFAMIPEEQIITAVEVYDGAHVDGENFEKLFKATEECNIEIKDAYGDKAYFRKPILDILKKNDVNTYIPVSESVYRLDEEQFAYNKDSDQWICAYGNVTIEKRYYNNRSRSRYCYYFDKAGCQICPSKNECSPKTSRKNLTVGLNTAEFYEYKQREKTEEFKEKYKKRARHEGKNGEMKRFHGLDRARGYGLRSMSTQAKLTAIAVNIKRIAKLVSSTNICFIDFLVFYLKKPKILKKFIVITY